MILWSEEKPMTEHLFFHFHAGIFLYHECFNILYSECFQCWWKDPMCHNRTMFRTYCMSHSPDKFSRCVYWYLGSIFYLLHALLFMFSLCALPLLWKKVPSYINKTYQTSLSHILPLTKKYFLGLDKIHNTVTHPGLIWSI